MANLLLITDVARLRKIFSRLAEDKSLRLRVVNNLEKGGEEIALEKPAVVFVQTHLSGLSSDIILMHLKKQLGRKRTRFVLIAAPNQVNEDILKSFQGWLDTSLDDNEILAAIREMITASPKTKAATVVPEDQVTPAVVAAVIEPSKAEPPPEPEPEAVPQETVQAASTQHLPARNAPEPDLPLDEQGIAYPPRTRLKIYSEFNTSFDNAVSAAPEPEQLADAHEQHERDWRQEQFDAAELPETRSKRASFLLWLVPVIIVVIVITLLQQYSFQDDTKAKTAKAVPVNAVKPAPAPAVPSVTVPPVAPQPAAPPVAASPVVAVPAVTPPVATAPAAPVPHPVAITPPVVAAPAPQTAKPAAVVPVQPAPAVAKPQPTPAVAKPLSAPVPAKIAAKQSAPVKQVSATKQKEAERVSAKAVRPTVTEETTKIVEQPTIANHISRPRALPGFIPRDGLDKDYSDANPGWERYTSSDMEYRVYRDGNSIKAIQLRSLGGISISRAFMNSVMKQLARTTNYTIESSVFNDGFRVERGHLANNLKIVFYRDDQASRLKAMVLTWQ